MEHGGFLDTRKPHPLTLGLIIAGHVAVLAAIILAPPDTIFKDPFKVLTVKNIPIDQPPPPTMRKPQSHERAQAPVVDTRPIVPTIPDIKPPTISTDWQKTITDTGRIVDVRPVVTEKAFVPATIDPSATDRFQPDYPPSLIRAEIEGTATVRILIGTDGQVKQVELVSATNPAFFDATRKQALRYWHFRPATTDGIPTESWRVMTVKFHLES